MNKNDLIVLITKEVNVTSDEMKYLQGSSYKNLLGIYEKVKQGEKFEMGNLEKFVIRKTEEKE